MKTIRAHQVIVGSATNDAITNMALEIQQCLQKFFSSDIYSFHPVGEELSDRIYGLDSLEHISENDILVYHVSFGIPDLTDFLLKRAEKLVVIYHNITPSHYYEELLPEFAAALDFGRKEIEILKDRISLAFAVSDFNADELRRMGLEQVYVLPTGANPFRLNNTSIDVSFLMELREHFPEGFILFVSQVLPHKRVDHAIEIIHLLRSINRINVGLVVAGPIRQPAYRFALNEIRDRLEGAHLLMTDGVSNECLATLYRSCLCFISTSEHEGLSLPPLEAMANGAPVVALGTSAIPETIRDGGIVLPAGAGVLEFVETIAAVISDSELQSALRLKGYERVQADFEINASEKFVEILVRETL